MSAFTKVGALFVLGVGVTVLGLWHAEGSLDADKQKVLVAAEFGRQLASCTSSSGWLQYMDRTTTLAARNGRSSSVQASGCG